MTQKNRQTTVRNLIVALLCLAALLWAWRYSAESGRPLTARDWASSLDSGRVEDKKFAAQRLVESGPDEIEVVVPALVHALEDKDAPVRAAATFSLGQYVCSSAPARPPGLADQAHAAANGLLGALKKDGDPIVRSSAAFALSSIRQALVKAGISSNEPKESDPIPRETLAAAFDAALKDDPSNRLTLIDALERLGPLPTEGTPGLLEALKDPSINVRGRVIMTLSHFKSGVDPVIPVLLNDLESNTSRYPPDYFEAAKEMHPSPAVVPMLIRSLESHNWMVREAAALLLAQIGPEAQAAAPALIAAAKKIMASADDLDAPKDSAGPQSGGGAVALSSLRPQEPRRGSVSLGLATALARIASPEEAMPILLEASRSKDSTTLNAAVTALAELGPKAQAAIPKLVAALKESLASGKRSAIGNSSAIILALGRIAPKAPETVASSTEVIATLGQALNALSESIRAAAAEALGNFGPRASSAIPRLLELQKEKAARVSDAAAKALTKISPESTPIGDSKDAEAAPRDPKR